MGEVERHVAFVRDGLRVSTLSALGRNSNVKTLLSNVEINNYQGGNDIFIDLIGDASDGELAAEYDDNDVKVTNLLSEDVVFYTGDHIDDLELTHAAPGVFAKVNLDMADQADIDGALIVDSGIDAVFLNILRYGGLDQPDR